LESTLNNFVEISAVILFLIIIGFLNLYITIPKKLKGFLSFLILNSVSIWLLHDLGWLKNIIIITSISKWLKTILKINIAVKRRPSWVLSQLLSTTAMTRFKELLVNNNSHYSIPVPSNNSFI